jgi:hypothetical protein
MKALRFSFCLSAVSLVGHASGGSVWTYVPASVDSRPLDSFETAEDPTEKVVNIVGTGSSGTRRQRAPINVVYFDFPVRSVEREGGQVSPASDDHAIPEATHWPDSNGRIAAAAASQSNPSAVAGIRNPWEVRAHDPSRGRETVYICGGIISARDGDAIAILNGHVGRRGETIDGFDIARVFADGVLMERDGSFYMIPRGRRTTISSVDD